MRRARWRTLPNDPATALKAWWRVSLARVPRPVKPRLRLERRGFSWFRVVATVATALACASLALLCVGCPVVGLSIVALVGAYALVAFFCVFVGVGATPPDLMALAPDPSPTDTFPVRVTLRRASARVREGAVATFVDGWLHVEGRHTAFSLRACDVGRLVELRWGALALELPDGQRAEFRAFGLQRAFEFREALRIWHHYAIESPEGESLFPPVG